MAVFADPKFLAGITAFVLGMGRVLGSRPGPAPSAAIGPISPGFAGTVAAQRASTLNASSSDILAQQMRSGAAVTAAFTQDDPRAIAARFRPAYIDMIRRSLAASAPLSGADAAAVVGSGQDLGAGLAPLAVLDRIQALDEQWGSALESYRQTLPVPLDNLKLRVRYINRGIGWSHPKTSRSLDMDGVRRSVSLGPVVFYDRMGRVIQTYTMQEGISGGVLRDSQGRILAVGDLEMPQGAGDVEITEETPTATTYYPARLAAIRATVEAIVWGRDVLRPWFAVVLDDSTGRLTPDWVSYLAMYQVTAKDLEAMAQSIAQAAQPRASGFESFLQAIGTGISFLMGGVNLISGVQSYAQNLGSAAAIDVGAAAREAGNLLNQSLGMYGAGVRMLSTGPDGSGDGATFEPAPIAPEERRLLQWMAQNPPPHGVQLTYWSRVRGSANGTGGAYWGSILRALGGGGVYLKPALGRLGDVAGLTQKIKDSGTVYPGPLDEIPGGLVLKAVLLARRFPLVVAGQYSQITVPNIGPLVGM